MALPNNNITPGRPPLLWSDVYDAFVQVNQNFDSIAATIGGASGPPRTITNITQADPAVVTTSIAHGYLDAQPVTLYTVVGMVEVNGTEYYAKRLSDTTFSLYSDDQLTTSIDSTSFNAYVSGGVVVGSLGIDPIDFTTLDSDIIPTSGNEYELGGPSNSWKNIYLAQTTDAPEDVNNGIWLGTARIQGIGGSADLPANSTVDGSLIIDPDKTFFKEVQVDDGESIIATDFGSALKITSGTAISVTVDSGAESLIIDNAGVTSLAGSTYIGVDVSTGNVTISNLGVTTVAAGAAVAGRTAGAGISVSGATGNVTITNTGILTVNSGSPGFITVSTDDPTGVATVSFNSGAVATAAFRYVVVDGDNIDFIEADNVADTLNLISGAGINITKVPGTDTITFNVNTNLDINGSVFADDSTLMVDAVDNKIYASGGFFGDITGNVSATTLRTAEDTIALGEEAGQTSQAQGAIAIGHYAGRTSQSDDAISIGWGAGEVSQGQASVAIGYNAGTDTQGQGAVAIGADASNQNQGDYSIAIGNLAGGPAQGANSIAIGKNAGNGTTTANSIILNATGSVLTSAAAGFYVDPIRSTANGTPLMYDTSTKELFSSSVLEFIGSTISTSDSSAVQFDGPVTFQTTVTADQGIQLNGVDAIIRSDDNIRLVPTNSLESVGAELTITGLDVMGEPYVIIETPTGQGTIQIGGDNNNTASVTVRKSTGEVYVGGFWRFLADGGLYSGYLSAPPDSPTAGAFYVADGATWDPASKSGAVPYPVFYDGASYHALY